MALLVQDVQQSKGAHADGHHNARMPWATQRRCCSAAASLAPRWEVRLRIARSKRMALPHNASTSLLELPHGMPSEHFDVASVKREVWPFPSPCEWREGACSFAGSSGLFVQRKGQPSAMAVAAVCASCPEAHQDTVSRLCLQHKIQKAFGRTGDMLDSLSGKDWIPKWEAKVVMATAAWIQSHKMFKQGVREIFT